MSIIYVFRKCLLMELLAWLNIYRIPHIPIELLDGNEFVIPQ